MNRPLTIALLAAAWLGGAQAQVYPAKPITVVIPNVPGGSSDPIARLVGAKLTDSWGQTVVLEHRAGANGLIGYNAARARPADGYTLFLGNDSQMVTSPHLTPSLGYYDQHFVPVIQGVNIEYVLAVHPSIPANTVPELIAYLKSNAGKVSYAHSGTASIHHLSMEMLKAAGGLAVGDVISIPYKGSGQYLVDMVAGVVRLAYGGIPQTMPFVKSGKLKAIAIGSGARLDAAPGVPTIAETYPGFETSSSWNYFVPVGTPAEVVVKLNAEINKILAMPDVRERFVSQGLYPIGGTPEKLSARMKADYEKWGAIIRKLNLKGEQ
ncbi:MAG: tripartite tricarboxylate transporter substrate binding protein [Betaproteobacteria bacterium]|nr:tripartite tricarboxylate transporter substrate binding protein [Betaproteobacteria bacterium]